MGLFRKATRHDYWRGESKGAIMNQIKDGKLALRQIPKSLRDEEVCRAALRYENNPWPHIPLRYTLSVSKIAKMIAEGQSDFPSNIYKVPERYRSKAFFKELLSHNGLSYEKEFQRMIAQLLPALSDKELDEYIEVAPEVFGLFSRPQQTLKRSELFIQKYAYRLSDVPENLLSEELVQLAIRNGAKLSDIPEAKRSVPIMRYFLGHVVLMTPSMLEGVPAGLYTQRLVNKLVLNNPNNIVAVPTQYLNAKLCIVSMNDFKVDPDCLEYIMSFIPASFVEEVKRNANYKIDFSRSYGSCPGGAPSLKDKINFYPFNVPLLEQFNDDPGNRGLFK